MSDRQRLDETFATWAAGALTSSGGTEPPQRLFVAFSGGLDSTVLLNTALHWARSQAGTRTRTDVRALHFNHCLTPEADSWQGHCARICAGLRTPLHSGRATGLESRHSGLEAAARQARYDYFKSVLSRSSDRLLLAHHADDQAETVMLRLLQGRGLLPMPAVRACGCGQLHRPLLSLPRAVLEAYARRAGLAWIEDPSNRDIEFDRNYLRARVWPVIDERWPDAAARINRVAGYAQLSADALASVLADRDRLSIEWCQAAYGRNLLRAWLQRFDEHRVSDRALTEFIRQLAAPPGQRPQLQLARGLLGRQGGPAGQVVYRPFRRAS